MPSPRSADAAEQVHRLNSQGPGDLHDRDQPDVASRPFDVADLCAVKFSVVAELLLAETTLTSGFAHVFAEDLARGRHTPDPLALTTIRLQTKPHIWITVGAMHRLITFTVAMGLLLAACGGGDSATTTSSETSSTTSSYVPVQERKEAEPKATDYEVGSELKAIADMAEDAGYRVEGLAPNDLRSLGGPRANEPIRAVAGITVLGPGLEGETSGGGGATVYAFASEDDAALQLQALEGLAAEAIGTHVYFVGQQPPSPGLEKLVDVVE